MLFVSTSLKKGSIFIPIEKWEGKIEDPDYVEGAIILKLDGKTFLDETLWDDVNYLWPYIINGLPKVLNGEDFRTGFPDQPITFLVKHVSQDTLMLHVFSKDEDFALVKIRKAEYLSEMLRAGRDFFMRIHEISPECEIAFDHYMKILSDVANEIGDKPS